MSYNPNNPNGQATMANSAPVVIASNQTALPITDNSGSLTVDNSGTFAVQDSEKVADNAGFTDGTTKVQPAGYILDETAGTALSENDAAAARIDSKRAQVYVMEDETTRGQRATVTTRKSQLMEGPTASGATLAASPVTTGGLAKTALPTAVTDGQVVNQMYDKFGRQVIINNSIRDLTGTQTTTISASTAETTVVTAGASGVFNDLVAIMISNTSATAARVDIRDTTGGSVIFQIYVPAGDIRGLSLTTPWPQTTAATNWTAQSSASVTDLRVSALYVKNK